MLIDFQDKKFKEVNTRLRQFIKPEIWYQMSKLRATNKNCIFDHTEIG